MHACLMTMRTTNSGNWREYSIDTLARLEQAFEQLRRFTSDASHELRTPLAMIRSVGEVGLQKDGTRAEYRDIVGSMLEEVNRLTSLIDNLLTISRADSGHIQLHRSLVPVMDLAREAAGLFEILLEEKSLRIVVEGEGAQVDGDYIFLRQALVNIIHNAVKYSPVGERSPSACSLTVKTASSLRLVTTVRGFQWRIRPRYLIGSIAWTKHGGANRAEPAWVFRL